MHLSKAHQGEHFVGLELMQSVLNAERQSKKKARAKVEVVGKGEGVVEHQGSLQQENVFNYGFCLNYSKVMDNLEEETH